MNIVRALINGIPLLLLAGAVFAVEVKDLYEAEVPVVDQSESVRRGAMAAALREVLVKVSGHSSAEQDLALDATAEAARAVQQYRYQRSSSGSQSNLSLWVRFERGVVEQLLHAHGLPVWGAQRPLTLVWLVVEEEGRRLLVGANDQGMAREALERGSRLRGLPINFPLLDLGDRANIQAADVWGDFREIILEASRRYAPQAVLVGRLHPLGGTTWQVRWSLYIGDEQLARWDAQGQSAEVMLSAGIRSTADHLALRFARLTDATGVVTMKVTDVAGLSAYRRVINYLTALHGVREVQVEAVAADAITLRLVFDGVKENIEQMLRLGDSLVPVNGAADSYTEMTYRLVP